MQVIKNPSDLYYTDAPDFKWVIRRSYLSYNCILLCLQPFISLQVYNIADIMIGRENKVHSSHGTDPSGISSWKDSSRAPIVVFGTRFFARERLRRHEGAMTKWSPYGMKEMLEYMSKAPKEKSVFPRKIVGIGSMDENWGWLSSHFLNRTVTWGFRFGHGDTFTSPYNQEVVTLSITLYYYHYSHSLLYV